MYKRDTITLGFTGASGMPYGFRLLECLIEAKKQVSIVMSPAAHMVVAMETELKLPSNIYKLEKYLSEHFNAQPGQLTVFAYNDWTAPIASGSGISQAMVICPCTGGCLAAVANGMSDNLLERAADVTLKESKKLIMVLREMPLSTVHLKNMLTLTKMGVHMLPANPGFYHRPKTIADLVDFVVARILDNLNIGHELLPRWGTEEKRDKSLETSI